MDDPGEVFLRAVSPMIGRGNVKSVGAAVSGGGDSMALLALLDRLSGALGVRVSAATVDHGLRKEARDEARLVESFARGRGLSHTTLEIKGGLGSGNLQDQARRERYRLLAEWAKECGLDAVALGHTMDDQAETLLLRLARGSGVDGLSGMAGESRHSGMLWLRPLLSIRRADLRAWLTSQGLSWIEDPSNDDPRFDRIKSRRALEELSAIGLDVATLAKTAANMRRARGALEAATARLARGHARVTDAGDVVLGDPVWEAPEEIQLRLLAASIQWVSRKGYPPRLETLLQGRDALLESRSFTMEGCLLHRHGEARVSREPEASLRASSSAACLWDGRWRISPDPPEGACVRALGEIGLGQCPGWRESGHPRSSLLSTPSIWSGERLISAPLAGLENGWSARIAADGGFFAE